MSGHRHVLGLCITMLLLAGCAASQTSWLEAPVSEVATPLLLPTSAPIFSTTQPARTPLPTMVPAEQVLDVGLRWRECVAEINWETWEACLGYPRSALQGSGVSGTRTPDGDLALQVNDDLYETRTRGSDLLQRTSLYKNGRAQRTIWDGTPFHPPNISLRLVDGKVAWEFYGERVQTVIHDGRDLRRQYGLDAAYRPYELDGKPIWIGKKDETYFVLYDGRQVGPTFDSITISYCCESSLYSPYFGEGRYVFWGQREGCSYIVELSPAGQTAP